MGIFDLNSLRTLSGLSALQSWIQGAVDSHPVICCVSLGKGLFYAHFSPFYVAGSGLDPEGLCLGSLLTRRTPDSAQSR